MCRRHIPVEGILSGRDWLPVGGSHYEEVVWLDVSDDGGGVDVYLSNGEVISFEQGEIGRAHV